MIDLDKEERELLEAYERNELKSVGEDFRSKYSDIACDTIQKRKRINIRISERDLHELKVYALREGIPYQTLISSILHKYITGQLRDEKGVR